VSELSEMLVQTRARVLSILQSPMAQVEFISLTSNFVRVSKSVERGQATKSSSTVLIIIGTRSYQIPAMRWMPKMAVHIHQTEGYPLLVAEIDLATYKQILRQFFESLTMKNRASVYLVRMARTAAIGWMQM
jgi:hypothetical protein